METTVNWVEAELESRGAILHGGHFVLKSGLHASDYIDLDYMFPYVDFMSHLGDYMASQIPSGVRIDALVAPATGGIALMQWVARGIVQRVLDGSANYGVSDNLLTFWADKTGPKEFAIERADWAKQLKGLSVVGVEDVVSTGGSLGDTLVQAYLAGAEVLGSVVVANRGNVTINDMLNKYGTATGCFLSHCFAVDFPAWLPNDCPMCSAGQPTHLDVGHGAKFARDNPDYPNKFDVFRK